MAPSTEAKVQPSQKRKVTATATATETGGWRNKRQKTQRDARTLAVQTSSKAFKNGELDVGAFVKAREYEIRALEEGMARARKGLTQRAFQQVPKDLRRRTASHNAKRVPKRLRGQAVREMAEDNTPTVTSRRRKVSGHMRLRMTTVNRLRALDRKANSKDKDKAKDVSEDVAPQGIQTRAPRSKKNKLASPPVPRAKYRKRQIHKTWLPTHLFHAKRARMTPPSQPLWRFALPLTSTAKSYRPTHRASKDRGAVAWDSSYMSCISVEGHEHSLQSLLRALGVGSLNDTQAPWGIKGDKWRSGSRIWQGWLYERNMYPSRPIAPATVIWRTEPSLPEEGGKKKPLRQVLIRLHPSAFVQLWEQVTQLAKIQKPQVTVEDLRFEIGSIQVVGPASTEALTGALWPVKPTDADTTISKAWSSLAGIQDLSMLPSNALVAFDIEDPRLHHPPRTAPAATNMQELELLNLLTEWPFDGAVTKSGLFDRKSRQAACRALPSQKAINRRKAAAPPGSYPEPVAQDPRIPVIAFPSPIQPRSSQVSKHQDLCAWEVLLPWKAVPPVWQSLMYYPISTGGQVRLGGLSEQRQIAFETGVPWFPADYPGTRAGDDWEVMESARRKAQWDARPKGKRVEWDSIVLGSGKKGEIGNGWSCDWSSILPREEAVSKQPQYFHLAPRVAQKQLDPAATTHETSLNPPNAISTVRITLIGRGTPEPCARIYRLPAPDVALKESLRDRWLALDPTQPKSLVQKKKRDRSLPSSVLRNSSAAMVQQQLAADLLQAPESTDESASHPEVPGEEDLIGFVTSGEFCLTRGRGVAIGSIYVDKLKNAVPVETLRKGAHSCIVRNAGETVGRLGKLEFV